MTSSGFHDPLKHDDETALSTLSQVVDGTEKQGNVSLSGELQAPELKAQAYNPDQLLYLLDLKIAEAASLKERAALIEQRGTVIRQTASLSADWLAVAEAHNTETAQLYKHQLDVQEQNSEAKLAMVERITKSILTLGGFATGTFLIYNGMVNEGIYIVGACLYTIAPEFVTKHFPGAGRKNEGNNHDS